MYQLLLPVHSLVRWILLFTLLYSWIRSAVALFKHSSFTRQDNLLRSITSGVSHLQLIIGLVLYFRSPVTTYFRTQTASAIANPDIAFFGLYHITFMVLAVLSITIGASKAKRDSLDAGKHRQIFRWFGVAVLLILLAIPWPFNTFGARPYLRTF